MIGGLPVAPLLHHIQSRGCAAPHALEHPLCESMALMNDGGMWRNAEHCRHEASWAAMVWGHAGQLFSNLLQDALWQRMPVLLTIASISSKTDCPQSSLCGESLASLVLNEHVLVWFERALYTESVRLLTVRCFVSCTNFEPDLQPSLEQYYFWLHTSLCTGAG